MTQEQPSQTPIIEQFRSVVEGRVDSLDRILTEEEARKVLPQLLLAGEEKGISSSASGLSSAIQITERGITINDAEVQVNHPQFRGSVNLSVELFNQEPWRLAARGLKVKVKGGNAVTRTFVSSLIKNNLGNPDQTIRKTLGNQIKEKTGGNRKLGRFGIQINPSHIICYNLPSVSLCLYQPSSTPYLAYGWL